MAGSSTLAEPRQYDSDTMRDRRMPIEVESPEEVGYGSIRCNLAESSTETIAGTRPRRTDHECMAADPS